MNSQHYIKLCILFPCIFISALSLQLELPYSNVTLHDDFSFSYKVIKDEIYILVKTNQDGYVALGFGPTMSYSDIMIVQFNGDSKPWLLDCTGQGSSKVPPLDKQQNLYLVGYNFTDKNKKVVLFKRKLNTGEEGYDFIIKENSSWEMIWAFDNRVEKYHEIQEHIGANHGAFKMKISNDQGTGDATIYTYSKFGQQMSEYHALIMFLAWGPLIDIGVIVVTIFKKQLQHNQMHKHIHAVILNVVSIVTVIATIYASVYRCQRKNSYFQENHYPKHFAYVSHVILALFFFVMLVVQYVLGMWVYLEKLIKGNNLSENYHKFRKFHKQFAIFVYLIAKLITLGGCYIKYEKNKAELIDIPFLVFGIYQISVWLIMLLCDKCSEKKQHQVDNQEE